jgi:hypothetical protein
MQRCQLLHFAGMLSTTADPLRSHRLNELPVSNSSGRMLFSTELDRAARLSIEKSGSRILANAARWTESVQWRHSRQRQYLNQAMRKPNADNSRGFAGRR